MHLASTRVGIIRRRRARRLGTTAVALEVLTFLATPFVHELFLVPYGLAVLTAPALSVFAIVTARNEEYEPGFVELGAEALRLVRAGGERSIPLAEVSGALVRDLRFLEIGLRDGDVISVEAPDPPMAHDFVLRLEERGARRLAIRAARPYLSWTPLVAPAGIAILVSSLLVMFITWRAGLMNPLTRLIAFALALITTWFTVHLRASEGLTLAEDGLTVSRAFSARFVPWSAIERTELVAGRLQLRLHDQRVIELLSGPRTQMRTATLIDRGLARSRGAASEGATAALERDGRTIEEWRAGLLALADEDVAYRGVHLPRPTLEQVLADPAAPAERRIGAALALRALDASYATRVRVAAESCANELLRIALEKVADDDVDVDVVDDAARAEQA